MTAVIPRRVDRPPTPRYVPGRCYALAHPGDTSTHCMAEGARFYPIGWRCDVHAPGKTSPTARKEAA